MWSVIKSLLLESGGNVQTRAEFFVSVVEFGSAPLYTAKESSSEYSARRVFVVEGSRLRR